MIEFMLGRAVCNVLTVDCQPDRQAVLQVDQLAWRWAAKQARERAVTDNTHRWACSWSSRTTWSIKNPARPLGNKGGICIELCICLQEATAIDEGKALVVQVMSPTIITPLLGMPQTFLACHYMKVLIPLSKVLLRVCVGHTQP
jgi:hypothetical protein